MRSVDVEFRSMESAMRMLAGCCGLVMVALLANAPSAAHAGWCAQYQTGGSNCGFSSEAQCRAAISGMGGWCIETADEAARPSERARERARERAAAPAKPRSRAVARPAQPPAAAERAPAATDAAPAATAPVAAPPPAARPATISPPAAAAKPAAVAALPDARVFAAARKLILDGQYEAGLAAMRNLRADNHPDVASYIGLAHRKLGRNAEAKAWYDKALAANPRHLQTLAFYGVLRAEQGDLAGARLDLQKIRLICGNTSCNEYVGLSGVIAGKAR
jgi:tetratricopeptide (TPR) repeat protein